MPHAGIMIDQAAGRRVHVELRPAVDCDVVAPSPSDFYVHNSYDEYGRVSVGSGDDCTTRILDNAPERFAKNCAVDVVADMSKFNFVVNSLPIRRRVGKHMILKDLENVTYLCAGSNSLIFSAIWKNQDVVVKVMLKHSTTEKPARKSDLFFPFVSCTPDASKVEN